jgi:hypothetical protein
MVTAITVNITPVSGMAWKEGREGGREVGRKKKGWMLREGRCAEGWKGEGRKEVEGGDVGRKEGYLDGRKEGWANLVLSDCMCRERLLAPLPDVIQVRQHRLGGVKGRKTLFFQRRRRNKGRGGLRLRRGGRSSHRSGGAG